MRDARLDGLIQKALSARVRETKESCANENLMAAYLEASLSDRETSEFEAHVAECPECQEVLALSMKLQNLETGSRPARSESGKKTLFRFSIPVPVFGAAVAAILLIAVFLPWRPGSGEREERTRMAELRSPVQEATAGKPTPLTDAPVEMNRKSAASEAVPEKVAPRLDRRVREKTTTEGQVAGQAAEKKKEDFAVADLRAAQAVPPSPAIDAIVTAESDAKVTDERGKTESAALKPQSTVPAPESPEPIEPTGAAAGARAAAAPQARESQGKPPVAGVLSHRAGMALNMAPGIDDIFKGKDLSQLSAADSRKVGDKVFYWNSGIWIDRESAEKRNAPIIEMPPGVPEYEKILSKYPEVRELVPVLIHWDGKNYLLR